MSTDYMSVEEFWRSGYIHEINRRFLHPLGLALEISYDDKIKEYHLSGIQDVRDDTGGMTFESLSSPKSNFIKDEIIKRMPARVAELGYWVQETAETAKNQREIDILEQVCLARYNEEKEIAEAGHPV